ncbi:MAG: TolC family protein [Gammaproteobacteria bacterium]
MIERHAYFLLATLLLANTATVAETAPNNLAIQTVIEAALERYPELVLPEAVRQQSDAIRQQASSFLADDPSLTLRHENDELTDNFGFRGWEGSVQLPLWLPGQRKRHLDIAAATEQEAAALTPFYKWRVSGEVRELLWSIRIAEAQAALAQTALDSAQALETDIDKRVQAGELAVTDQILARQETLAREITLNTTTANLSALRKEYEVLTGLSELPASIVEMDAQGTGLSDQHPALVAADLRINLARSVRDKSRHEKRTNPVLAIGTRHERAESGQPYDTIMTLELSLPLGLKGHSAPAIADAERQLTEQQVSYASIQRDIEKQRVLAVSEKQRTAQALRLARQQQQLAAERIRLIRRAFELGESDLFTLLQAQKLALAAERDLQISQLEQGRAIARYNQALGVIPE